MKVIIKYLMILGRAGAVWRLPGRVLCYSRLSGERKRYGPIV